MLCVWSDSVPSSLRGTLSNRPILVRLPRLDSRWRRRIAARDLLSSPNTSGWSILLAANGAIFADSMDEDDGGCCESPALEGDEGPRTATSRSLRKLERRLLIRRTRVARPSGVAVPRSDSVLGTGTPPFTFSTGGSAVATTESPPGESKIPSASAAIPM